MPSRSFSWPVMAARILLVALAAGAAAAAFVISRSDADAPGASGPARYACPMHPAVTAAGVFSDLLRVAARASRAGATTPRAAAVPAAAAESEPPSVEVRKGAR